MLHHKNVKIVRAHVQLIVVHVQLDQIEIQKLTNVFVMIDIMKILFVNHVNNHALTVLLYEYVHHDKIQLINQDLHVNGCLTCIDTNQIINPSKNCVCKSGDYQVGLNCSQCVTPCQTCQINQDHFQCVLKFIKLKSITYVYVMMDILMSIIFANNANIHAQNANYKMIIVWSVQIQIMIQSVINVYVNMDLALQELIISIVHSVNIHVLIAQVVQTLVSLALIIIDSNLKLTNVYVSKVILIQELIVYNVHHNVLLVQNNLINFYHVLTLIINYNQMIVIINQVIILIIKRIVYDVSILIQLLIKIFAYLVKIDIILLKDNVNVQKGIIILIFIVNNVIRIVVNVTHNLNVNNQCLKCQIPCLECLDIQTCKTCSDNYIIDDQGKCTQCIQNCEYCIDSTNCVKCFDEFYYHDQACIPCSDQCQTCVQDSKFFTLCKDSNHILQLIISQINKLNLSN
ncbi:unnamed protein product [Paramecium pentaurelia]|uniref:Transmembrane protein n=1 Tax=Paramecium pentaurelia TaxID=43138 RepID=A0A8S1YIW5_9CILI|nr:unnamed protein product [Paramecium pentaurelia]